MTPLIWMRMEGGRRLGGPAHAFPNGRLNSLCHLVHRAPDVVWAIDATETERCRLCLIRLAMKPRERRAGP